MAIRRTTASAGAFWSVTPVTLGLTIPVVTFLAKEVIASAYQIVRYADDILEATYRIEDSVGEFGRLQQTRDLLRELAQQQTQNQTPKPARRPGAPGISAEAGE
ncbi:MAG: hypothetical protein KY462_07675 [Actinobacteria bacterium]|nr:hypothetical protein [Actinomycetota bacterium]